MTDADIIRKLGGPTKLAERLNFDRATGVQRVHNWLKRGIPARVLLDHAAVFREAERSPATANEPADQAAG
jgi:hypothetical protein